VTDTVLLGRFATRPWARSPGRPGLPGRHRSRARLGTAAQVLVARRHGAGQPPQVTITTQATSIQIPGFDEITLERLTLLRSVGPADTTLVEQVCQAADDLGDQPGKLRGKRLAEVVNALNALGGTWQLAPSQAPTTG
jgi:hypothetical protein